MEIALLDIPKPARILSIFCGSAVAVQATKGTPGIWYLKVSNFTKSVRNSLPLYNLFD